MDQARFLLEDKVEVKVPREARWIRAKLARVVDDLSCVVEYLEAGGGAKMATEYLHLKFIRPAEERLPREISEFQLGPGAAVQAYCDGAWTAGVVHRVLGEGAYEVSIHGKEAKRLVTKMIMPQYNWNGKQWTLVTAKAIQRGQSNPTKKSRKELQQLDAISADDSEHASVSEMDTAFSALCKMPDRKHSPSSSSQLSQKNSLQEVSCRVVGLPQNESVPKSNGETVDKQELLSEIMVSDGLLDAPLCVVSAGDAHNMPPISKLGKLSSHRQIRRKVVCSKVLKERKDISKNIGGKTRPIQVLLGENDASEIMVSDGLLDTPLCVASAGDAHNMLPISELGKKMPSPHRQIRRKVICSKILMENKDISKNK